MSLVTRYQQLKDRDSSDHVEKNAFLAASNEAKWDYRAAFWGLSILYLITIGLGSVAWATKAFPHHYSAVPHDHTVVFGPLEPYDASERTLLPNGRGFVHIPVGTELHDGTFSSGKGNYAISMFHQMHCIASLRTAFEDMSSNNMSENKTKSARSIHHPMNDPMDHYAHCFDYLLQGVMCAGDMSLELATEIKGSTASSVDGWNVTHQCRNYQLIYDFAEKHRYLNTSGVL